jgi:hypothetical protein
MNNRPLLLILFLWLGIILSRDKTDATNLINDLNSKSTLLVDSTGWSDPALIPVYLENRHAVAPYIAHNKGTLYIAYQTAHENNPFPHDVWIVEKNNEDWSQPQKVAETTLTLTGSRVAVLEENGRVVRHLLWGDQPPDDGFNLKNPMPFIASNYILYSYFDGNRETWSDPDTLYHTPKRSLIFSPDLISNEGALYFVFSAFDSTGIQNRGYKNFIKRRHKEQWTPHNPVAQGTGEADLIILADGTFIYSYIRPDTMWVKKNFQPDVNSVFVKQSLDAGETWNETQIQRSGRTPAYSPNVEANGSGTAHLFWKQDTNGNRTANDIAHSWSEDGGDTWTVPEMILKSSEIDSGFIQSYDVVVTKSGCVHVLFISKDGLGSRTGGLYHAYWKDDSWEISQPLFELPILTNLSVAYDEKNKKLQLVFMAKPNDQGQEAYWRLYHSVLQD